MTKDETPTEQTDPDDTGLLGSVLRVGLLVAVVFFMLWLVLNVDLPTLSDVQADVAMLRSTIADFGWWALPAFAVAYALVAVTPIPVTIMAVSAGILFGTIQGSLLSIAGVLLGSWGAYWLARALGRSLVRRLLGDRFAGLEEKLDSQGFEGVFLLRVMPGMPYWPINYGSGAFGVPQRDFVVATGMAAIPGQVSLVAIGAFAISPSVVNGIVVVLSWAVVLVMTIWAYRSLRGTSSRDLPGSGLVGGDD